LALFILVRLQKYHFLTEWKPFSVSVEDIRVILSAWTLPKEAALKIRPSPCLLLPHFSVVLGVDPRAFCLLSKPSITELHPKPGLFSLHSAWTHISPGQVSVIFGLLRGTGFRE
jgi:hypothetical protein